MNRTNDVEVSCKQERRKAGLEQAVVKSTTRIKDRRVTFNLELIRFDSHLAGMVPRIPNSLDS